MTANNIYTTIHLGEEVGKRGDDIEAFKILQAILPIKTEDSMNVNAAWIIYHYLKHEWDNLTNVDIKKAFFLYLRSAFIGVSYDIVHTCMLLLAYKLYEQDPTFKYCRFMEIWGMQRCPESVFHPNVQGEEVYPPLMQKLLSPILAMIKESKQKDFPISLYFAIPMLEKLIACDVDYKKQHTDAKNIMHPHNLRYLAILYLKYYGEERAIEQYLKTLQVNKSAYIYKELSDLVYDRVTQLGLVCIGLSKQKDVLLASNMILTVIKILIERDELAEAATLWKAFEKGYSDKNKEISNYARRIAQPCVDSTPTSSVDSICQKYMSLANDFLYQNHHRCIGVIDYYNKNKSVYHILSGEGKIIYYKTKEKWAIGACVMCYGANESMDRVLHIALADIEDLSGNFPSASFKLGTIDVESKRYVFWNNQSKLVVPFSKWTSKKPILKSTIDIYYIKRENKEGHTFLQFVSCVK